MPSPFTTSTFLGGAGRFDSNPGGPDTWSGVRDAGSSTNNSASYEIEAEKSGTDYRCQRVNLPVDTSSIPADATVLTVAITGNFNYEGGASGTIVHLVKSSQASTSSRNNSDFSAFPGLTGTLTSGGSINVNNSSPTQQTINGNATALGWVVKGGTTLIGLVSAHDLTNTAPTGTDDFATMTSPSITITYSTPAGGMFLLNFM